MEAFCKLVLRASCNYAGTQAPTMGPTLMSVGNGPSRAVLSDPTASFLPITVKQGGFHNSLLQNHTASVLCPGF